MPSNSSDIENLISKIKTISSTKEKPLIIGIDGVDGSGKSTLAHLLGTILKCPVIHLDNFLLNKSEDTFLNQLDSEVLNTVLDSFLKKADLLILEGIMLLDIINQIHHKEFLFIYKVPYKSDFRCFYEDFCNIFSTEERMTIPNSLKQFQKDLIEYHKKHRLIDTMDLTFEGDLSD